MTFDMGAPQPPRTGWTPGGATAAPGAAPDSGAAPAGGRPPVRLGLWPGIWLVARLDLIQRLRTSRTGWTLLAWVVAIYGFVGLAALATHNMGPQDQGAIFYGVTIFVVLTLALLVTPSLSAGAVTGDRSEGVLATLQVTLLSPAQIALGKFLAAWLAALGFLAIAAPVLLWALAVGGVSGWSLVAALATLAIVTGTVCAIGLAISSLTARVVSSVALTYLVLGLLALGSPLLFALTLPLTETQGPVRMLVNDASGWQPQAGSNELPPCVERINVDTVAHTERTWWLLAANPYVIVADAAPGSTDPQRSGAEPLGVIRDGVRAARRGAVEPIDHCYARSLTQNGSTGAAPDSGGAVWLVGLATYVVIGAGALMLAVRRLRTPVRRLARGTRIA